MFALSGEENREAIQKEIENCPKTTIIIIIEGINLSLASYLATTVDASITNGIDAKSIFEH
jgi:hypothetical protein